jgi:hypothetical protein
VASQLFLIGNPAFPQTCLSLKSAFSCHMRLGETPWSSCMLIALLCTGYVLVGWTLVALLYCDSYTVILCCRSLDGSVSVVTMGWTTGIGDEIFFATAFRPALESVQWLLGLFFQERDFGYGSWPVPYNAEDNMSGYIPPLPHTSLWRATQLSCGT